VARFLDRVWFWVSNAKATDEDSDEVLRALHTTIKKVTEDLENYKFNTVVSSLMSLHNEIKDQSCSKASMLVFAQMLYPIAPHIAEEIAELLGSEGSLQFSTWPTADESLLGAETMKVVVQVNGKVKDTLVLPLGTSEEEIKTQAMQSERVQATLTGKEPQRVIYVEGKLLNIVI
jgi:leucyl-tRNA synthetase